MRNNPPLLDQAADDTQRIVDGALCLLDHQFVGAPNHDAHRLAGAGTACDLREANVYQRVSHSASPTGAVFLFWVPVFGYSLYIKHDESLT